MAHYENGKKVLRKCFKKNLSIIRYDDPAANPRMILKVAYQAVHDTLGEKELIRLV